MVMSTWEWVPYIRKTSRSHSSFLKGVEKNVDVNSKSFFSPASKNPIKSQSSHIPFSWPETGDGYRTIYSSAVHHLHLSAGLSGRTMAGPVGHLEGSNEFQRGRRRGAIASPCVPGSCVFPPTWMHMQPLGTWTRALGTIHYASDHTNLQLPGELR